MRRARLEPYEIVAGGFALLLLAWAVTLFAGCGTPATIARKVVTGIDAADGAAARIARQWVHKCGEDAKALRDKGDLDGADKAYVKCEDTATKLVMAVVTVEDAAQVTSNGIDAGEAVASKDYSGLIGPLLLLARNLMKVFADAGLKLPAISGVL